LFVTTGVYVYSPVFDGLFDFCSMYTGASLEGAYKLNNEVCMLLNISHHVLFIPYTEYLHFLKHFVQHVVKRRRNAFFL